MNIFSRNTVFSEQKPLRPRFVTVYCIQRSYNKHKAQMKMLGLRQTSMMELLTTFA